MLAAHPRRSRQRSEFAPPVRLHPFQAHLIAHSEDGAAILIVRALRGRQDRERALV